METTAGYAGMELSAPNYRDWKAAATLFESLSIYTTIAATMTGGTEPRRVNGGTSSADLLVTLGVSPIIGRSFTADDEREGAARVVILSYRLSQTEFGGDTDIVGRTLVFDDAPVSLVAVMPREFHFPRSDRPVLEPGALHGSRLPGKRADQQQVLRHRPTEARPDGRARAE